MILVRGVAMALVRLALLFTSNLCSKSRSCQGSVMILVMGGVMALVRLALLLGGILLLAQTSPKNEH